MITKPLYPRPIPNYRLINNIWGTASDGDIRVSKTGDN